MEDVVIVAAARTAIGSFMGTLSTTPAAVLGAKVVQALLARTGLQPNQIDEVIMGHVLTAGCGERWFCADDLASRSDLAVFLIRAIQARSGRPLNEFGYPAQAYFTDVPTTDGRFPYVQAMRAAGITSGCTATAFCAGAPITRGELAVFLIRGLLPGVTLPDP